jgi:ABC-type dipeptide/oligopeptide/nickel transport system permease subunit
MTRSRTLRSFVRNVPAMVGAGVLAVCLACALFAPFLAPYDPIVQDTANRLKGPTAAHWLGTDDFGRDILSRIIYGSRTSMLVGVAATSIGLSLGTLLGVLGGFAGGRTDQGIMRGMDILLSFPYILLAIVIMALLGPGISNLMIAIGVSRLPIFARVSRSVVLAIKHNEYIDAARSLGARDRRLLARHVLPNVIPPLIVQGTASLAEAVVVAASLNFLGLGIQPPTPDWGAMVSDGRRYVFDRYYIPLFPGLAITAAVLSMNLVGDWVRDVLDPRQRQAI